jgi:hypothetical protein
MTRRRRIDDFLWLFVTRPRVYLQTVVLVGMLIPLLAAATLPVATAPWIWVYLVVVLACAATLFALAFSHERWLAWSARLRQDEDERRGVVTRVRRSWDRQRDHNRELIDAVTREDDSRWS